MIIEEIVEFNRAFVQDENYTNYETSKYPDKKLAIVSCMDTRLMELLPAALGLKNGDAKIIKNAGGVITHPFGSVVRSLLVAIFELGVSEIMVIGHTDCGVRALNSQKMHDAMLARGISEKDINILKYGGIDFDKWLGGFANEEASVKASVDLLKEHPLIPKDVSIQGFIIDSKTGKLRQVN